jgi:hypothetical protein
MPTAGNKQPDSPDTAADKPDPRDARIVELEQQLAAIQRPTITIQGLPVRLKVEPPHSELHYAGRIIGTDYTEVPANMASAYMEAAADAGVTLTQDQEG